MIHPKISGERREQLIATARAGGYLDPAQALPVRIVDYEAPDRQGNGTGELIALITSILNPDDASSNDHDITPTKSNDPTTTAPHPPSKSASSP